MHLLYPIIVALSFALPLVAAGCWFTSARRLRAMRTDRTTLIHALRDHYESFGYDLSDVSDDDLYNAVIRTAFLCKDFGQAGARLLDAISNLATRAQIKGATDPRHPYPSLADFDDHAARRIQEASSNKSPQPTPPPPPPRRRPLADRLADFFSTLNRRWH